MLLGKVVRRVVSSAKHPNLPPRALLEIQVYDVESLAASAGAPLIAIDSVGAGPGEMVLILQEGTGAREALSLDSSFALPAQAVVVGIVDAIQRD